jgi:hypothetical protein
MPDRRREARLENTAATFSIFNSHGDQIPCSVKNLSRRGVGVALPASVNEKDFPVGSEIQSTLTLHNKAFEVASTVRVANGLFRGLEFVNCSKDFQSKMSRLLSPKYIASTIVPLKENELANHLEYAFRGNEFEVLSFKTGRSRVKRMIQIFAAGHIVEISGTTASNVPAPLVRRVGDENDYAFMSEFADSNESIPVVDLKEFFRWIDEIIQEWPECPQDFREAVKEQLSLSS